MFCGVVELLCLLSHIGHIGKRAVLSELTRQLTCCRHLAGAFWPSYYKEPNIIKIVF